MGQVASTVYNIFSLKGGGGDVVFSDSGTTLFNTIPADTDEIDLFKSTKSFKSPTSKSSSSSVESYKSITGVSPMSISSSSPDTSPSLLTPLPVVPIISTYTANAIELLITPNHPLPGPTTLTRKPSIGSTAIETSYLANTSYKFFFGYEIIKGYTSSNNMNVEIMNTSPTSTNIRSLRQTLLEKWLSTDTTTHQTTLNLANIDEYLQHFYRMFIYNTIANKELTKNKSKYDNNINTFVKIAKDSFNNMLTDSNNCITFWKQISKNATSTLSANYGLELEKKTTLRTLIETTSAGFNKTSSQCEILFDTKLSEGTAHTCAFCGIQFTVKKNQSQGRGMAVFSCEHVLEVFPLAMILGLTPNMSLYDAQTKEYLQQLYVNFGSYVIACQRCNMIKSKLQTNETYGILVDLIQQGTTNNELEFVRNDSVIEEFVNRICNPLDTNGGSYIRQVYDYTASTYPDLVNDLPTPFSYYYKKVAGKPFEVLINNSYDKWLIVNNAHPGYDDIPTIPTIPAFDNDGHAHVYIISPFPDAYKSQPDNIQLFKNSLITRIRNILNPLVSNLNLMCNLWSHPQIKITPGILDIAGTSATNDEINQLKGKFNTHGFILRILASFPMIFLEVLNNKRKSWSVKMHENIPPSQYLINGGRCNPLYGGGEKRKKSQSVDNTSPSHKIKRVDKDEVLYDIMLLYFDSENPILDLYLQLHADFIDIIEKIGINYLLNNVNNTNTVFNVKSNFIHLIEHYQKLFCIHPTHVQLNGATIWIEPTTNNINIFSNINNIKYNNYFIYTAGEDRSNPDEVVKFNNFEQMDTNVIIKIITMLNDIIDKFNDLFRSSHVDCSEMYTSVINDDKTNIPTNQCNIQNIFTNVSNNAVEMINKDNPQTCTSKCKGILQKLININLLHTWVPPNNKNNNAKQIKKGGTFSNDKTIKSRINKKKHQTRKKRTGSTKKKKNTKQRSQTKRN